MSKRTPRKPVFSALNRDECAAVLARNHVGRIAYFNHGVVDIEPVHYVAGGEWLFVRSADGTKLDAFAHHPYVAFEVDEVEGTFDWRSIVAHGTVYLMSEEGTGVEHHEFERALTALRTFIPESLGADDPTPVRRTVYGVHLDRLVGRMASQKKVASAARAPLAPRTPRTRPRNPTGF